jgi:hypothetical protein
MSRLFEVHTNRLASSQQYQTLGASKNPTTLKGGPTGSRLWEQCADLRGKTHPEDAIPLYFKLLPNAVNQGASNARYESAFRIVQSIGKLRKQQDRIAEFKQELARIRLEYKAKRNFIKLLSTLG